MNKKECKRCGQQMMVKEGLHSSNSFWGCSGYPECGYMEECEEEKIEDEWLDIYDEEYVL